MDLKKKPVDLNCPVSTHVAIISNRRDDVMGQFEGMLGKVRKMRTCVDISKEVCEVAQIERTVEELKKKWSDLNGTSKQAVGKYLLCVRPGHCMVGHHWWRPGSGKQGHLLQGGRDHWGGGGGWHQSVGVSTPLRTTAASRLRPHCTGAMGGSSPPSKKRRGQDHRESRPPPAGRRHAWPATSSFGGGEPHR